jgi:hypothetical protein
VLFGPAFAAQGMWRGKLRSAYRRKVMETHPDRARALGRSEAQLAREFRAVAEAYRVLRLFGGGPAQARAAPSATRPAWRAAPTAAPRSASGRRRRDPVPGAGQARATRAARPEARTPRGTARGAKAVPSPLPRRRLRLAEYLLHSGRVSFAAFAEALAWQWAQRPALGRVAVEFGFLAPGQVQEILERRRLDGASRVPFGEYAVRAGYLTELQRLASLGRQMVAQRRVGRFFVERGLIGEAELDDLRRELWRHNARWPKWR